MTRPPTALTIAGSDSGGGAGLQADLKTFLACRVHGMSAVTAVTAQHSRGVEAVHAVPGSMVAAQVMAVATDIGVDATKTGMLANADVVSAVVQVIQSVDVGPLVAARRPPARGRCGGGADLAAVSARHVGDAEPA
jgi:hydroxymethylpyrimidine/phosphomethylpyrimidine kinase